MIEDDDDQLYLHFCDKHNEKSLEKLNFKLKYFITNNNQQNYGNFIVVSQ